MVICLERGADLHTVQLMPLPLTVSCFSKILTGFTFLVPAHPVVPDQGPLNGCVCVCVVRYVTGTGKEDGSILGLTSAGPRGRDGIPERPFCKYPASK